MSEKLFSPQLISWAMERTGMDIAELAGRMKTTPEKLEAWSNGGAEPTFAQAEKLAKAAYLPVAVLMLDKVPQMIEGMADFRTHDSRPLSNQSTALEAAILDARACQDWYRDYLEKNGVDKNDFAGCLRKVDDPDRAAETIKASLGIDEIRIEAKTVEQYLSRLVFKIETDLGVCVMRAGHVKNNPRRTLTPEEFRGFALADAVAPLIFVNSRE